MKLLRYATSTIPRELPLDSTFPRGSIERHTRADSFSIHSPTLLTLSRFRTSISRVHCTLFRAYLELSTVCSCGQRRPPAPRNISQMKIAFSTPAIAAVVDIKLPGDRLRLKELHGCKRFGDKRTLFPAPLKVVAA